MNAIPETFDRLKTITKAILSMFSLMWACELLSEMNFINNEFQNWMTDKSNSAFILLKITKYNPDTKSLTSNMQQQTSH